jgi:hypothetical protein
MAGDAGINKRGGDQVTERKWYHAALGALAAIASALVIALLVVLKQRPKQAPKIDPATLDYEMVSTDQVCAELDALGLRCANPNDPEDALWKFPIGDGWDRIAPTILVPGKLWVVDFNDCDDFITQACGDASRHYGVKIIRVYGAVDTINMAGYHAFGLLRRAAGVYDIFEPSTGALVNVQPWITPGKPNAYGYEPYCYFK